MSNKDIIKYFYEVVVSENLLDELHKYISEDCVQRVGEKAYFIGTEGMKQHLLAVKQTYPDYTLKILSGRIGSRKRKAVRNLSSVTYQ